MVRVVEKGVGGTGGIIVCNPRKVKGSAFTTGFPSTLFVSARKDAGDVSITHLPHPAD